MVTPAPLSPVGFATINPFFIVHDADGLMTFLREVFGGEEHLDARTVDHDGLLLHAELELSGTTLMFGDRKPGWPYLPQLNQIYVDDVDAVLVRAAERGARIVTTPTDFFGTVFSRMVDPWGNLWWVYRHGEPTAWEPAKDAAHDTDADHDVDGDEVEWTEPGLRYTHETLLEVMPGLGVDPRSAR